MQHVKCLPPTDYLYITMRGYEENLQAACQLLSRQILMPKLDDKQLARIKGSLLGERQQRKENVQILADGFESISLLPRQIKLY